MRKVGQVAYLTIKNVMGRRNLTQIVQYCPIDTDKEPIHQFPKGEIGVGMRPNQIDGWRKKMICNHQSPSLREINLSICEKYHVDVPIYCFVIQLVVDR